MPGKCLRDVALGQPAGCEMGLTLESEEGEVPHLRWSQAPPLPWPRPGSADFTPQFEDQATERNAPGRYDRQTPVGKDETCGEGPWQSTQNFPAYKTTTHILRVERQMVSTFRRKHRGPLQFVE